MRGFLALASALWRYAGKRRPLVVLYTIMFIIGNIVWLFEPFFIGRLLNQLQLAATEGASGSRIVMYLIIIVLLSAGFWFMHGPARYLERATAFHIRVAFKQHLFNTITSLPLQWQKNHHSGQTINRIAKATNSLYDFSQNGYQLIEMVIRPLGALVALTLILPMASVLTVGAMILACIVVFLFDRVLFPLYERVLEKEHKVASVLHDYITNITTVITLRLEFLTQSELYKRMTHYWPIFRKEIALNEIKWFIATMAISITTALVMGWYALSTISMGDVLFAGTFFMLYDYLQKIGGAFYTFAWKYGQMIEQYADLKTVDAILRADRPELHDCKLPESWKAIELRNIDFTYSDEEKRTHHLKDISLILKKGRKIAFVGESGSGKSTLMVLIRGLQLADGGRCSATERRFRTDSKTSAAR
jgi:ATP-binding cassette subfamily B protein